MWRDGQKSESVLMSGDLKSQKGKTPHRLVENIDLNRRFNGQNYEGGRKGCVFDMKDRCNPVPGVR